MLQQYINDMIAADQDRIMFFAGHGERPPYRVYRDGSGKTDLSVGQFAALAAEAKTLCGGDKAAIRLPDGMVTAEHIHHASLQWIEASTSDSFAITLLLRASASS